MAATWGRKFKITIFGESHGQEIGVVIDGVKPGVYLDFDEINFEMMRRSPGRDRYSTARKEDDFPRILSGVFEKHTTGAPLAISIKNSDKHSKDYESIKNLPRPGHADYTAFVKFGGQNDYRGGGHFSGRITAPLVFAGAVAKQILREKDIFIISHIKSIYDIEDKKFSRGDFSIESIEKLKYMRFPFIDETKIKKVENLVDRVKNNRDSVGGVVECAILGIGAGVGSPFFESIESVISSMMFSIPSVKGIEFGDGFDITKSFGSSANDEMFIDGGKISHKTNHNGGVLGGITNGMPIIFRLAIKPTPSISREQNTVDISKKDDAVLNIKGRHDPIIVPRIIPVVEAAAAISILDCIMMENEL